MSTNLYRISLAWTSVTSVVWKRRMATHARHWRRIIPASIAALLIASTVAQGGMIVIRDRAIEDCSPPFLRCQLFLPMQIEFPQIVRLELFPIPPDPDPEFYAGITFYDIAQSVDVVPPVNWVTTVQNVGPDPVPFADDDSLQNVSFIYAGDSPISGPANLPMLTIEYEGASLIGTRVSYRGLAFESGQLVPNFGEALVVPEPGTSLLTALGFFAATALRSLCWGLQRLSLRPA